jgi:diaminohydroxyphosphoribosylaminopyrimidine deaminase/5-amino-6-(5-phosphoribosylamino)uracil reductase
MLEQRFPEQVVPQRTPLRIVFDSQTTLSPDSILAQTARESLVIVAISHDQYEQNFAVRQNTMTLEQLGCEVIRLKGKTYHERVMTLFDDLARRGVTNLLLEGGGTLLGELFDHQLIDEAHVFIAPKIIGGSNAVVPVAGQGIASMIEAMTFEKTHIQQIDNDIYYWGRLQKS